jgi:hypothetical protein
MIIVIFTKICYEHLVIILTQSNDGSNDNWTQNGLWLFLPVIDRS